jgi:uncharacterized protein (DUF1800 family)
MATDERARVGHLLRRTGFGATPSELDAWQKLGFDQAVDQLLHPDQVQEADLDGEFAKLGYDITTPQGLAAWWLYRMINTKRPLAEKLALFWHGHFATSVQKVKSVVLMQQQNQLFREHGLDPFADLAKSVAQDPAMLVWLDNWKSKKEQPNENFGRELLELFTLGVGNYTEDDVKASSRAFTGWSMLIKTNAIIGDEDVAQPSLMTSDPDDQTATAAKEAKAAKRKERQTRDADFLFRKNWHDDGQKTFLGVTGALDGNDIIDIIVKQPACAQFIAGKLFSFFVWDQPDEATVAPFADVFAKTNGDIRALLDAIFRSDAFSSDQAYRAKVRSPIEFVVTVHRLLGLVNPVKRTLDSLNAMGQVPFLPPNVGGWTSGLGWIGPSAALERCNFVLAAAKGGGKVGKKQPASPFLRQLLATSGGADLVGAVVTQLLDGDLDAGQRATLAAYLDLGANGAKQPFAASAPHAAAKLAGLIRLAASTSAFQRA